jgi:hypothetical protein
MFPSKINNGRENKTSKNVTLLNDITNKIIQKSKDKPNNLIKRFVNFNLIMYLILINENTKTNAYTNKST